MQGKLDQILRLSHELVFDHGVKQDVIFKEITKHLRKTSTKKEYVLYNDCHGGFSYSDEYCEYAKVYKRECKRHGYRDKIISYGKMLCDKYPKVASMLHKYHTLNMKHETSKCLKYRTLKKNKDMMEKNLSQFLQLPSGTRIEYGDVLQGIVYSCMYSMVSLKMNPKGKYQVQQLIDLLKSHIHDTSQEIQDVYPSLMLPILEHLDNKTVNTDRKLSKLTFISAITQLGESDPNIWNYQKHVCSTTMKCMLLMDDHAPNAEALDEYVYECFGLLGASGTYACLKFAEVPAELSWNISEYDGLEHVYVV